MKINQAFLKFKPILKEKIWGGTKLVEVLKKESDKKNIGESWEISDVEGDTSVVENGELKGLNLKELIRRYTSQLLGHKVFRHFQYKFPLLIKFIDAEKPLSIQLHPNDYLAQKRHNSFGKTEMWYVMDGSKGANLILGFQKDSNKEEYLHHLRNKSLTDILNTESVVKGDVFFIPTGRVHAIGAGVMLAEIQQTSDITYRIYDWDRQDKEGNYRELHTEEALDAIDFKASESYKTLYKSEINSPSELISCPYFITNLLPIEGSISKNNSEKDSFVIYICVEGEVAFTLGEEVERIRCGETILVPAVVKEFLVVSKGKSELLEVYLP